MPPAFKRSVPMVWAENVPESVAYYEKTLGFECQFQKAFGFEGRPGALAVIERDGLELQVWTCQCPDKRHQGLAYFMIEVEDVDALHEELAAAGASVLYELQTHPWGIRDFTIEDPDGNRIEFSCHVDVEQEDGS